MISCFYFDVNEAIVTQRVRENITVHFLKLLDAMLRDLDQSIEAVSLVSDNEFQRIVVNFNSETADRESISVLDLFERNVQKNPDQVAILGGDVCLSYQQLCDQSQELARELQRHGVVRGDYVAICLPRSADMIRTVLAVLNCGAAYVPLDPAFPDQRTEFMLSDTGAKW